jgi:putative PIN family toxin of toxin-antitoxin system
LRILPDTNVLISAYATRGLCADLLREVIDGHELVCAEYVLGELERILRTKLKVPPTLLERHLRSLRRYTIAPHAVAPSDIELRDPDDLPVLGAAIAAGVDVLVTGDRDLLAIADQVGSVRIVAPRELWELIRPAP